MSSVVRTGLALLSLFVLDAVAPLVVFGGARSAHAAPAAITASSFLEAKQAKLKSIFAAPTKTAADVAAQDAKADAELDALIDTTQMAKDTLGAEYDKRTDGERKAFTDLFKQLVQKEYRKSLRGIRGYDVAYLGEKAATKTSDVVVHTEATDPLDKRAIVIEADYVLRKTTAGFMIVDFAYSGAKTFVYSQNKNVTAELKKPAGWDGLLATMKAKAAKP